MDVSSVFSNDTLVYISEAGNVTLDNVDLRIIAKPQNNPTIKVDNSLSFSIKNSFISVRARIRSTKLPMRRN
jgi:hypothetical protein